MFHLLEETVDLQGRLTELSGLLASSTILLLHIRDFKIQRDGR